MFLLAHQTNISKKGKYLGRFLRNEMITYHLFHSTKFYCSQTEKNFFATG